MEYVLILTVNSNDIQTEPILLVGKDHVELSKKAEERFLIECKKHCQNWASFDQDTIESFLDDGCFETDYGLTVYICWPTVNEV